MGCGASRAVAHDPDVFLVAHEPALPRLVDGDGARALALEPVASSRFVGEWRQLYGAYTIVEDAAHAVALGEAVAATLVPVGVPVGNINTVVPPAAADAPRSRSGARREASRRGGEGVLRRARRRRARLVGREPRRLGAERAGRRSSAPRREPGVVGDAVQLRAVRDGAAARRAATSRPRPCPPRARTRRGRCTRARASTSTGAASGRRAGRWCAAAGGAFSGASFVGEFDTAASSLRARPTAAADESRGAARRSSCPRRRAGARASAWRRASTRCSSRASPPSTGGCMISRSRRRRLDTASR